QARGVGRYTAAGMEPGSRQTFEPAGAGGILIGVTAAAIAFGALVGWAAGWIALGCLGGAVGGIPAGVYSAYRRYKCVLSGDPHLAVAAAVTYGLAYTLELGLSLAAFFGSAR